MSTEPKDSPTIYTPKQRLRRKNWAMFGMLLGFAALMFAITIIKMNIVMHR